MSDSDLYLNPTQMGPETTQPVVGFKPYQNPTQLATQMAQQKWTPAGSRTCWKQLCLGGQPLNSDSYMVSEVYPNSQPA